MWMWLGSFSRWVILCILFLNRVWKGLMSLNCMLLGRLFMLWWFLMLVVFLLFVDLIMLGYSVFCVRNLKLLSLVVLCLKVWMNLCLMILCFCLGLFMFVSWLRNLFLVFIVIRLMLRGVRVVFICLCLLRCSRLWLINMVVSCLFIVFVSSSVSVEEFILFEMLSSIWFVLFICVCMFLMSLFMMCLVF